MPKIGKTAFVFSALLGLAVTQPLVSFAGSPNAAAYQNAQLVSPVQSELGRPTLPQVQPTPRGTGVYDNYDAYRGQNGFPLPGDAQLFLPLD